MDTDVVSRLLNYLITHVTVGTVTLIIIIASIFSIWGINIYTWAVAFDTWIIWLLGIIVIFALGDLVDAAALLFIDYFLLRKRYIQRPSEIDLTSDHIIRLVVKCNILTAEEINKDNAKQVLSDIVPSLFVSSAPPYIQSKREDVDSLYQYHSNMFLLLLVSFPLVPIILYKHFDALVISVIMIVHLILLYMFYRFVVNGLARVFSIEDKFFFGYLLEHAQVVDHREQNERKDDPKRKLNRSLLQKLCALIMSNTDPVNE